MPYLWERLLGNTVGKGSNGGGASTSLRLHNVCIERGQIKMARCAKCNQEVTTGYVLCERCYKKMDGIKEDSIKEILGDNYDLDRLKELVQADREGRCEVIPREEFFLRLNSNIYVIDDGEALEVLLYIIGRDQNGIGFIDVVYLPRHENEKRLRFRFSDVGKTVFLTREEAEAALEKMKGGNE